MSEETLGHGVVGTSNSSSANRSPYAELILGLLSIAVSVWLFYIQGPKTSLPTLPVLMLFGGLCIVMYARYEWSGVLVPSIVFAGIAAFRSLNFGVEPQLLVGMYPTGWVILLVASVLTLVVAVRRLR